jgi:ankyrin repeat protein
MRLFFKGISSLLSVLMMILLQGCSSCWHVQMLERAYQTMRYDDIQEFRKALVRDPSIAHMTDTDGWTLLMHAVQDNKVDYVDELCACGAKVNVSERTEDLTALHLSRTVGMARRLIERGGDINATGLRGTPLMFSMGRAYDGSALAVWFIEQGADVNVGDTDGYTPIMIAARLGREWRPVLEMLLDRGANVNARAKHGRTILHQLAYSETIDISILRVLLNHGGDPFIRDKWGITPLDLFREAEKHDATGMYHRATEMMSSPGGQSAWSPVTN